mmetsp:Transcript_37520/g.99729  ORF Transcript_37520/g.99729 Transcript_37520/m.99729 type:complete len:288 (-) Transcript_37520:1226-2089(-)
MRGMRGAPEGGVPRRVPGLAVGTTSEGVRGRAPRPRNGTERRGGTRSRGGNGTTGAAGSLKPSDDQRTADSDRKSPETCKMGSTSEKMYRRKKSTPSASVLRLEERHRSQSRPDPGTGDKRPRTIAPLRMSGTFQRMTRSAIENSRRPESAERPSRPSGTPSRPVKLRSHQRSHQWWRQRDHQSVTRAPRGARPTMGPPQIADQRPQRCHELTMSLFPSPLLTTTGAATLAMADLRITLSFQTLKRKSARNTVQRSWRLASSSWKARRNRRIREATCSTKGRRRMTN